MSLTVRYFASVREAMGIASESWPTDIPTPTTVAQARATGCPWLTLGGGAGGIAGVARCGQSANGRCGSPIGATR